MNKKDNQLLAVGLKLSIEAINTGKLGTAKLIITDLLETLCEVTQEADNEILKILSNRSAGIIVENSK